MAIECSALIALVHAFNAGSFKQFQIKDCDVSEMGRKVEGVTQGPHMVTDYASYESSIDIDYRVIELHVLLALCVKFRFVNTYKAIMKHCFQGRVLTARGLKLWITTRCSGDYYTSFGNGIMSYCIMTYCAKRNGVKSFSALFEGDDGIVAANVPNLDILNDLGFKFSCSITGNKPGDCDFLSSRWMGGKRYINIPKYLVNFMWVKTMKKLKRSKVLFIWRCMGASLYHLSPGHPILTSLVNYIGKITSGINSFKGYEKFIDHYKYPGFNSSYPRDVVVDDSMRLGVAEGSAQFCPISISDQILIERNISQGVFHFGDVFDSDEYFTHSVRSFRTETGNKNLLTLLETLE
jgi:hypothetical protein